MAMPKIDCTQAATSSLLDAGLGWFGCGGRWGHQGAPWSLDLFKSFCTTEFKSTGRCRTFAPATGNVARSDEPGWLKVGQDQLDASLSRPGGATNSLLSLGTRTSSTV